MTSAIDATKPVTGNPTTESVRSNFTIAASEISALQDLGLDALTAAEITQIGNIDSETIINSQWAYLGASDQALATSDSITHVNFTATGYIYSSVTGSITAGSTQTQAGATALTTDVNFVTVSGTNGDGVKLPTAVAGSRVLILNEDSAQTIQIWPNTSDTIDGGSADAVDSSSLAAGARREYAADGATNWVTVTASAAGGGDLVSTNNLSDVSSATTSATNLGLGTGDSPQFTGIELGHATDTTIVRSGAGDITIEGNAVYRAGGTDVPVADGGTGASTLTDGGVLLGSGTGAVTAMAVLADSEMIVGNGTTDPVAESGATLRTSIGVAIGTDVLAEGDTSIGKHTIWVPAAAMEAAVTTAAATSNAVEIGTSLFAARTMDFATGADDFAYFGIQMPKSWNAGTLICQFVWSATGTTGNTVLWAIAAVALADTEVLTTAFPTPVSPPADTNSTTADDIMISAEVTVTVDDTPAAENYVMFEVSRDVSGDTLAEDARLHGIRIHYTTNAGNDT